MISSARISGLELRGAGEGIVGFETVFIVSPRQFCLVSVRYANFNRFAAH